MNIEKINKELATKTPIEIVQWAINVAQTPIVTTNFRPYEAAILHLVTSVDSKIKVIWCDTMVCGMDKQMILLMLLQINYLFAL